MLFLHSSLQPQPTRDHIVPSFGRKPESSALTWTPAFTGVTKRKLLSGGIKGQVPGNLHAQQGIALVLVLWVMMLLAVIAGSFVYTARSNTLVSSNLVAQARARLLADAGIERGIYEALKPAADAERWQTRSLPYSFALDSAQIQVTMRDEAARIDLNTGNEALLKGLLVSLGVEADSADRLLDAIVDWRDADELIRPQGAERDQYESAGLNYIPANAPFQSVEEMRLVIGMTPELFRKMQPALTVYSKQAGINSRQAPREVLMALPNVLAEDVDAYLVLREDMHAQEQTPSPFPQAAAYEASGATQVYNLRSVVSLADGARFANEAVVKLTNKPNRPYAVLRWQEANISPDDFRQPPDNRDATQP